MPNFIKKIFYVLILFGWNVEDSDDNRLKEESNDEAF